MELAKRFNQMSILDWKKLGTYQEKYGPMDGWTDQMYEDVFPPNRSYDSSRNHVKGQ